MKYLKNITPYSPIAATDVVTHSGKKIASKAFIDSEYLKLDFSFADGESIDKVFMR
ncbi:hypothetical protein KHA80_14990 [Anaerobacillus sp. HL2]|nr:hypothetical protein KHA80_14990 [Anaerobacillus sp. HL2]